VSEACIQPDFDDCPEAVDGPFELLVSDRHWDRNAACYGTNSEDFYVGSRDSADPFDVIGRCCAKCDVAEDCLTETICLHDTEVAIVAGLPRKRLKVLVDQHRAVQKEQKKENSDPTINMAGIVEAIRTQVAVLKSDDYKNQLTLNDTLGSNTKTRRIYTKKPSIDPERIKAFWENANPIELTVVREGRLPYRKQPAK